MSKLKSALFVLLLAIALPLAAKEYKYETVPGDLMATRIYKLDNGLTVYLSVNNEKPRIQTYIAVRTGSRNDPPETTGLAHYLEHLMFKGTRQFGTTNAAAEAPLLDSIQNRFEVYRTIKDSLQRRAYYHKIDSLSQLAAKYFIPNEYDKLMSAIGAEGTNAFTSNDMTCYVEDIPSNEVENWARIEADRFQNMVIRGFHTELEAVYEEYNIGLASDREKQFNAFSKLVFPGHPYGTQTTIGTQEHLKNPSIVNIKNYFKRYYVPNNVAICMSGDFNPDEVIAIIDKYFGSWKPSANLSQPQYAPVPDRTAPVDTTVVGQEAENIYLGWKFEGSASYQADTLSVVADILSNGTAGLMDLDLDQQMKWLGGGAVTMPLAEYSAMIMIGYPKEGQTLDEVKALMLGEIDKLKRGDFDENLIKAVVNNKKLQYYRTLESNDDRAYMMADAFITRKKWSDVVGELDRISGITKQQIIDFARRHFTDGYVAVYKRIGNDTTIKKIDKPEITAIPANRDLQSAFVKEITDSKVEPIQPKFVDFDKDLTKATTKNGLPVLYVKNTENGRFTLTYHFDFGGASDKWLPYAAEYFDYLGTDKMTAEQLKQKFYSLACSHGISIGTRAANIYVSGLAENMTEAMALMDDLLANAKVDTAAYNKYVGVELKSRADNKLDQVTNFSRLMQYGMYGEYNPTRNIPSSKELKDMEPQRLVDKIKAFNGYKHTVLYYGPMELNELVAAIDKHHKTAKTLADAPKSRNYMMQQTAQNEVYIAPYDAKNIYMVQYHNENRQWNPANQPVVSLFNEYYGGGMNSVVFQELREARGLAYSAFADYGTPSYEGEPEYAYTYIISQNDKMTDCIRTFNSILDTMPQSEKALGLAKQALMKRLATARTTKEGIINAYLNAKDLGIDYSLSKKIYEAVPSLTMDDVVKFERETMAKKPYRYLILGDEKQLDMKALEKIGPIKRLTTEEIFGY
jgi:predicted Zn-dependent peptidase